ncbi:MAG: FecR domain-containing protein [Phycisphaerae bacterium]|nr:FecR domain-containing protein [Phycisphaerae bacterium]
MAWTVQHGWIRGAAFVLVAGATSLLATSARAQPAEPPDSARKAPRKAVFDLTGDARRARPGSMVPESMAPAPARPAPVPAAVPVPGSKRSGNLPAGVDAPRGAPRPAPAVLRASVNSALGRAEWSGAGAAWQAVRGGESVTGPTDLRTGRGSEVAVQLADNVTLRVMRLSRVKVQLGQDSEGRSGTEVVIDRGDVRVEVAQVDPDGPLAKPIWVVTPDSRTVITGRGMAVGYNVLTGTSRRRLDWR